MCRCVAAAVVQIVGVVSHIGLRIGLRIIDVGIVRFERLMLLDRCVRLVMFDMDNRLFRLIWRQWFVGRDWSDSLNFHVLLL